MTGGGLAAADVLPGRTHHLEVTAPRFSMPGNEVFGVFPPPNADGPFAGRLAQIVLRSRTLPWDRAATPGRAVAGARRARPGRGDVPARRSGVPGVHAGARAGRDPDATPGAPPSRYRARRSTTPSRPPPRLELLAHVRQVDPAETEYADSDGWVSVVIANRLPQPGTAYAAYLISLEGQRDVLPPPGDVEQGGIRPGVFDDLVDLEDLLDIRVVIGGDPALPPVGPVGRSARSVPSARSSPTTPAAALEAVTGDRAAATSSGVFSVTSSRLVRHDIDWTVVGTVTGLDQTLLRHVALPGAGALGVHVLGGVG